MKKDNKYEKDFKLIGERIKFLREKQNLSIKDLSIKTKISARYLAKIENGLAFGMCINKHLLVIANVLNVKISELFEF
ncbi:helix-turn-helix transcriptional regulator [bacterium]|nr:helix-turn-helix transcriptional regulator [bacterium]